MKIKNLLPCISRCMLISYKNIPLDPCVCSWYCPESVLCALFILSVPLLKNVQWSTYFLCRITFRCVLFNLFRFRIVEMFSFFNIMFFSFIGKWKINGSPRAPKHFRGPIDSEKLHSIDPERNKETTKMEILNSIYQLAFQEGRKGKHSWILRNIMKWVVIYQQGPVFYF